MNQERGIASPQPPQTKVEVVFAPPNPLAIEAPPQERVIDIHAQGEKTGNGAGEHIRKTAENIVDLVRPTVENIAEHPTKIANLVGAALPVVSPAVDVLHAVQNPPPAQVAYGEASYEHPILTPKGEVKVPATMAPQPKDFKTGDVWPPKPLDTSHVRDALKGIVGKVNEAHQQETPSFTYGDMAPLTSFDKLSKDAITGKTMALGKDDAKVVQDALTAMGLEEFKVSEGSMIMATIPVEENGVQKAPGFVFVEVTWGEKHLLWAVAGQSINHVSPKTNAQGLVLYDFADKGALVVSPARRDLGKDQATFSQFIPLSDGTIVLYDVDSLPDDKAKGVTRTWLPWGYTIPDAKTADGMTIQFVPMPDGSVWPTAPVFIDPAKPTPVPMQRAENSITLASFKRGEPAGRVSLETPVENMTNGQYRTMTKQELAEKKMYSGQILKYNGHKIDFVSNFFNLKGVNPDEVDKRFADYGIHVDNDATVNLLYQTSYDPSKTVEMHGAQGGMGFVFYRPEKDPVTSRDIYTIVFLPAELQTFNIDKGWGNMTVGHINDSILSLFWMGNHPADVGKRVVYNDIGSGKSNGIGPKLNSYTKFLDIAIPPSAPQAKVKGS